MKISAYIKSGKRAADGLAEIYIKHDNDREYQLDLPFADFYRRCGVPSSRVLDLLVTAGLCYIVDKTVSRKLAENGWTRELEVNIPVSEPRVWSRVAPGLSETLTFLTGDEWSLSFHKAEEILFEPPKGKPLPLPAEPGFQTVCLFSGGLDSLGGAIDLLSDRSNGKVLLIGHYDGSGPRSVQARLASELACEYPDRVWIEHIRVAHRPAEANEETLRSRSLVFIALGLYAAQAAGPNTSLHMFENGFIALNVPLTPSRRSSCSTRTMHPYFLHRLSEIIATLGLSIPIVNPYALKTKGECVVGCENGPLLARLEPLSVSCSHSSRRQDWLRRTAKNCGYCVPCICRRAALFMARIDNGRDYGRDVIAGELAVEDRMESANDLRAIMDLLSSSPTESELRRRILAVANFPGTDAYAQLALRGIAEIRAFLIRKATKSASRRHA